ncbi:hypothetical protein CRENBAI_014815 [Crenichthys baileyi]|uniref:Uncharacterized protein n=1 Tax=Crenichthys baileyi TaxID=28760 RepID=A0AAV9QUX9_9TELE
MSPHPGIQLPPRHRNLCWALHTFSAWFGTALRLHHSLSGRVPTPCCLKIITPAEDAAAVRTLFPPLLRFGQAPPCPSRRASAPSSCLASPTLFPSSRLVPAITQRPLVAPGRRMRHSLLPRAYLEARSQETVVCLASALQISMEKPTSAAFASTEAQPHASALASASTSGFIEGSTDSPAPVSTGGPSATSTPVPDLSDVSADTTASVSAGGQPNAPASVSAGGQPDNPAPAFTGGQPDTSVPASAFPVQPPVTTAQPLLPAYLLGFLWAILSEIFSVPAPVSVGRPSSEGQPSSLLWSSAAQPSSSSSPPASASTVGSVYDSVSVSTEGRPDASPPVSDEGQPDASVSVSAEGQPEASVSSPFSTED